MLRFNRSMALPAISSRFGSLKQMGMTQGGDAKSIPPIQRHLCNVSSPAVQRVAGFISLLRTRLDI
jgi:hypothetical protein